jgi:hypothetical protein
MMFQISYGIGGGYNVNDTELIEANNLDEALRIAYEASLSLFESYTVFEDQVYYEELDDEEIQALYLEEAERWIDYHAEYAEEV